MERYSGSKLLAFTREENFVLRGQKLGNWRSSRSKMTFTRRTTLSTISKIFDPLGILAPVTITGKILMQDIWRDKNASSHTLVDILTFGFSFPSKPRGKQIIHKYARERANLKIATFPQAIYVRAVVAASEAI